MLMAKHDRTPPSVWGQLSEALRRHHSYPDAYLAERARADALAGAKTPPGWNPPWGWKCCPRCSGSGILQADEPEQGEP